MFNPAQVRRLFLQPLPRCEAEAVASVGAFIYHRGHRYSFQSLLQGCPAVNDARIIEAVMSLELSFPIVEDFSPDELGRNEENSGDDTDVTGVDGDNDSGGDGGDGGDRGNDEDSGDKAANGDGNGDGNGNGNDGDGDGNDGDDAGDGAGDNEGDGEEDMINPYDMPDYDDTVEEVNWSVQDDAQNNENVQDLVRWARPLKTVSTEPMLRNYFNLKDTMRSNDSRHRFRILGLARPYGFSV